MYPSGATCPPADCCVSKLALLCVGLVQSATLSHILLVITTIYLTHFSFAVKQQSIAPFHCCHRNNPLIIIIYRLFCHN